MDTGPAPARPTHAAPLTTHAKLERMSEPWALNRFFVIAVTLIVAVVLGSWTANGEYENLVLFAVWFGAVMVIVFVQDYWWAPIMVISAFSFSTTVADIPLTGAEIGLFVLCLALPTKMAMKTLRKAEPEMTLSRFYWALLAYVVIHAVVILAYNHTLGIPLKNIVKAYYSVLTSLVIYGLVIRYCHVRTVRGTVLAVFFTYFFTIVCGAIVLLTGIDVDFSSFHFSLQWLTGIGAINVLRAASPYVFIFCLAYWPAARNNFGRFALAVGIFTGAFGALISGGRLSLANTLIAGVFFAVVRRRLWLAFPFVIFVLGASTAISINPDITTGLPLTIQRALEPLDFSGAQTTLKEELGGSNGWHDNLRSLSIVYWLQDPNSFYLGHGFKSWDPQMNNLTEVSEADLDHFQELAIEMGLTENMFSAITNIFGLVGLILYGCFMFHLLWMLYRGIRVTPQRTMARALCEFSIVNLATSILFCPLEGSIPSGPILYWALGILAARPYLAGKLGSLVAAPAEVVVAPERPAFARPAYAAQAAPVPPPAHRFKPRSA